jgi:hypothetical protein
MAESKAICARRGARALALSAIIALVAAWMMAPAVAAPATSAPALGKVTVIRGSRSAVSRVRLPHDTTYVAKTGENASFDILGGGRFAGVLLVAVDGGLERDGVSLFVGRYGFCPTVGCTPDETSQFLISRGTSPAGAGSRTLPAGDYTLYLFTDGAPARVTMKLGGLRGTAALSPRKTVRAEVGEPQTAVMAPGNVAYANGTTAQFDGTKGFTFQVMRVAGGTWTAGRYGDCLYRGEPPIPGAVSYVAPECPGGLSVSQFDVAPKLSSFGFDYYAQTLLDPGTWSFGSFYQGAGLIDPPQALVLTVDLL